MKTIFFSSLLFILLSANALSVSASQCEAWVNDQYHNPSREDVSNLRQMVNDAEEGLAELETLIVRGAEDVVVARQATIKVSALVALAGEPDEVGSMAARGYLSRRGVDWGQSVHKDVQASIQQQPHIFSEPGETTPLLGEVIHSTPKGAISSVAFKWAGRAFLVAGVSASVVHVYAADDHTEAAFEEGASWAASLAYGEAAGLSCIATGAEVIVPLCVIIGGLVGGLLGQQLGDALYHGGDPDCYHPNTGWDNCSQTIRPPI